MVTKDLQTLSLKFDQVMFNTILLFFIQYLEQLLKFLLNCTFLKYVKSQRSYGFLITKELIFAFQILDLKDHFSASLCTVFHKFDSFFLFDFNIAKMHIFCSFFLKKGYCCFREKMMFIGNHFQES